MQWMKNASDDRRRLVKHSLRTLIQQGHPKALQAMGFTVKPKVEVSFAINTKRLRTGQKLEMTAEIKSVGRRMQKLVVDYTVHFRKANGSLSPKVFKWKVLQLEPGQVVRLKKRHHFVSRSVRKLYTGGHQVALTIAGGEMGLCSFELEDE